MMTKASYYMNEHLKKNVSLLQTVAPNVTIARARLPFQQGLDYIDQLFRGKHPADMYCHEYFIEKQTDPNQPSPQLHLTEEYQGMLKIMKGLRYMSDRSAKLDTTMVAVEAPQSDDHVVVYNPVELDDRTLEDLLTVFGKVRDIDGTVRAMNEQDRKRIEQRAVSPGTAESEGASGGGGGAGPMMSAARTIVQRAPRGTKSVSYFVLPTKQSLQQSIFFWLQAFPEAKVCIATRAVDFEKVLPNPQAEEVRRELLSEAYRSRLVFLGDAQTHKTDVVTLATGMHLVPVVGDDTTNEFVLVDANSGTLSCTDLFHGAYGDYDPLNSWLCRVFFKFMKDGDYKRLDMVPKYKMNAVVQQGGLADVQATVERLCGGSNKWGVSKSAALETELELASWDTLIFAHGSPPQVDQAKDTLRVQWGLAPEDHRVQRTKNGPEEEPELPDHCKTYSSASDKRKTTK